jgi:lipoyl synthase
LPYFYDLLKEGTMKGNDNTDRKNNRLPSWLRMKLPGGYNYSKVRNLSLKHNLHTICASGNCPNTGECWNNGTATFMILGDICTRNCKFCGVKTGRPGPVDREEPARLAETIRTLELSHCVITSVDRDDLPDGGAGIWAEAIRSIKRLNPHTTLEALIPDFNGEESLVRMIIGEMPEVISHNLETVRRLTPLVRSRARYETSLGVIRAVADSPVRAKSGIMLGLGETREEVIETMDDLLNAGCEVLTIGQYLAPTIAHMPVAEYVEPLRFEELGRIAREKGFLFVESSPLVRSSYHAEKHAATTEKRNISKYVKKSNFSGSGVR